MTPSLTLSADWDRISTIRMGVAQLTQLAFSGKDLRGLWHALMEKVTDDPAGAGIGMDLSIISQLLGDQHTGLAIQEETLGLRTLFRSPLAISPPRLRVLALAAVVDIGGNTPLEFLLEGSDIELVTYYAVPGVPLPSPMPDHDVAIVVAPDGDAAAASMKAITALVEVWPRPVLNLPARIQFLDRDRLYQTLQGVAGLKIPKTARVGRRDVRDLSRKQTNVSTFFENGDFPIIIRPTGSHAGFGLAKIDCPAALAGYLTDRPEETFFISPFVDYRSGDGLFRKYRIVFVDRKPYACHMAIAEEWKVWYLNADMALSVPHRLEEGLFMSTFDSDFGQRHAETLAEVAWHIGLDYFVIDCAETREGKLLVFEADNTAIVHDMDPPSVYPYKSVQMQKIFKAFQDMFYRRAELAHAA